MRHDALVEDIYRWLRRKGIYVVSNDENERLDLWVRVEGELIWCDVIVTDPACPSILAAAAKEAGAAVEKAESSKRSATVSSQRAEATLIPLLADEANLWKTFSAKCRLHSLKGKPPAGWAITSTLH